MKKENQLNFQKLFKNPGKLMDIVKKVGNKLDNKMNDYNQVTAFNFSSAIDKLFSIVLDCLVINSTIELA